MSLVAGQNRVSQSEFDKALYSQCFILRRHRRQPVTTAIEKKTAYGNTISFLFFFYGYSKESLSAINLYGQLMILMFFLMIILWFSCFSCIFFNEQLPIPYLNSSKYFKYLEIFKKQEECPSATCGVELSVFLNGKKDFYLCRSLSNTISL